MAVVVCVALVLLACLEVFVMVQVAAAIGWLATIAVMIVISIFGARLCKRQGLEIIRRVRAQVQSRELPGNAVLDGVLVLFAGLLLVTPGFVSDAVGAALLVPPVRVAARGAGKAAIARRIALTTVLFRP